jgi:hypothetical protein
MVCLPATWLYADPLSNCARSIEMTEKYDAASAAAVGKGTDDTHIRMGKLNLVDLAG